MSSGEIILEKDKVYKIIHKCLFGGEFKRNYIICSPKEDVHIKEGQSVTFDTHFTVCFSGFVIIHKLLHDNGTVDTSLPSSTTMHSSYDLAPLIDYDMQDMRKALAMLDGKYRYNRKLNQLIPIDDDNI